MKVCHFFAVALLIIGLGKPGAFAQDTGPVISIEVQLNKSADSRAWEITWRAEGLDPNQLNYQLQLKDWGEWSRADSLFLRNLESNVQLEKVDGSSIKYQLVPPTDWDGRVQVSYRIIMMDRHSSARETFGLMPWYDDTYCQGYTSNTLMDLFVGGNAVQGKRRVSFRAKPDELIVSGWGKSSRGAQAVELDGPIGNTIVLFGTPVRTGSTMPRDAGIEIIQFGKGPAFPDAVVSNVAEVYQSFVTSTKLTPGKVKLVFTDTHGGGINVDGAMVVGYGDNGVDDMYVLMTMAHEFFHEWLGGGFVQVKNPESVWFQEGFTDYLSLWHLAHCGLITEQQLVDRLVQLDSELDKNSAKGSVSFADASVNWRDGGPNEQLAYKGAAILAFCTDVELRKNGHPGLSKMITDLAKQGRSIGNIEIRDWYQTNGLGEFHVNFVAKPNEVDFESALKSIGCEQVGLPVTVAYAGFNNDNEGPFGTITDVDPDGPAAKAGLKAGDMISGFWPSQERNVDLIDNSAPKFKYGLNRFPVDETIHFNVIRNGKEVQLKFEPDQLCNIATKQAFKADPVKIKSFLGLD